MHTIVLATQKGGRGKSTLAIGLALAARQAGYSVRLIETDPQGTLSNWQRRRTDAEPVVEPIYHASDIEPRLNMLAEGGLQLAIVDTAAGLSAATTAAIRYSDLCLIPTRPSVADIEATAGSPQRLHFAVRSGTAPSATSAPPPPASATLSCPSPKVATIAENTSAKTAASAIA